jgi:hypothetical protein
MAIPEKQEAREVLVEKFKTVISYVADIERRVEHLNVEMNKIILKVPPVGMDFLLDEIHRILDEVHVAGPSKSLIEGDLKSAETSLGAEYALNKQARIVRFVAAREAIHTACSDQSEL